MKTIVGLVVPADMEEPVTELRFVSDDALNAMQKVVGGYVDVVDTALPETTVWLNDEGMIKYLEPNPRATMFIWAGAPRRRGGQAYYGDVLITGQPDEEGNTTSLPDELLDLILRTDEYKIEVQTGGDSWAGNGKRFADYWIALHYVLELAERWVLVTNVRVVAS
ncbi:DUF3846 domain-containing protein [Antrihabitans sp. YC2-6]|uniref:DUF3846 domain-containing protein n=1 Tax=Antrihabitans sp. YC2-6 TaxID=2799498 RepID=UPI0018F32961|nr:DUF3846 domain-containing protein [Antrihabitans sp. YC2-6]MBJ8343976.1 DUF3846 domain-containing protein [Antrihabitans sp. YC2-6]